MSELTPTAVCEKALDLYARAQTIKQTSADLNREPNQSARAILAQADSLANACEGVLGIAFETLGIDPMAVIFGAGPKDFADEASQEKLRITEVLLGVAAEALAISESKFDEYSTPQDDRPEVIVDDEAYNKLVTELTAAHDREVQFAEIIGARLRTLTERHGDKTLAASRINEVLQHFLTGASQDLEIGRGEEVYTKERLEEEVANLTSESGLLSELTREIVDEGLNYDEIIDWAKKRYDTKSAGTRTGFLRSAADETALARKTSRLLVEELNKVEPIPQPLPCLLGRGPGGTASVTND